MNIKEYNELLKKLESRSKYNNQKVKFKGETFDSVKERDYYILLLDRQKRGEICNLKRQVSIEIQEAFTMPTGEKIQAINYIADFTYSDVKEGKYYGDYHIVDTKGYKTDVYKLKKKLLAYRGIYIEEV